MYLLLSCLVWAQDVAPQEPQGLVGDDAAAEAGSVASLVLDGDERVALEVLLAGAAALSGQQRVDYLLPLIGSSESAAVNAGIARGLAASYALTADHEGVRAAALELPPRVAEVDPVEKERLASERLAKVREYKAQRLEIREETELRGGGLNAISGPTWGSPVSAPIVIDPVYAVTRWGIYQGSARLTVPEYLELTEQEALREALLVDVQRSELQSKVFYGVGVTGVAVASVGMLAQLGAEPDSIAAWRLTATVGVVAAVVGFVGGSVPSARAKELEQEPDFRFTPEQVQPRLDAYNEQLRVRLGVDAQDVLMIEALGDRGSSRL